MWETKETLEGGLQIDRWWWVVVKIGTLIAVSGPDRLWHGPGVPIALVIAFNVTVICSKQSGCSFE